MSGYIGVQPVPQTTQTRESFTATAGQTSFGTSGYQLNHLDVYLNGVKLAAADYTATNGSDVVLASGAAVNDILEIVAFQSFTVLNQTLTGTTTIDTLTVTNAITANSTVDGRDVAADGTKLDTIETSATADQTDAEIRAAVEAATDSNVFTDADHSKLNGIEANATADQSNAEIRAAVEAASDSNVFTDADHSKLNGIEASSDVTDATNVTAAGALMDSEVTNLAQVKAFDSSDYATAAQGTLATNALPKAGGTMTGNIAHASDFTIDVAGDIILDADGGDVSFRDAGVGFLNITNSSTDAVIQSLQNDKDLIFKGVDGGASITALTLDMSDAGTATFNHDVKATGNFDLPNANTFITGAGHNVVQVDSTKTYLYGGTGGVQFRTADNASALVDIDNSGRLLIGTTNTYFADADDLVVAGSGSQGITIASGTAHHGNIFFADGTSGNDRYMGIVRYDHHENNMLFYTNGANERMRIDSVGNVLIGSTNNSPATNNVAGSSHGSLGNIQASVDGNPCLFVNRKSNDGDIVSFRKDGTSVGSIGVSGGNNMYLSGQASNHAGVTFATQSILPTTQGTVNDNTVDLGQNGNAYKDLYLGGGVFLGGTAAANKLDDYEEGSFTPSFNGYTSGFVGTYTKVGNLVTIRIARWASIPSSSITGNLTITGLPFTAGANGTNNSGSGQNTHQMHIRSATSGQANAPWGMIYGTSMMMHMPSSFGSSNIYPAQAATYDAAKLPQNGSTSCILDFNFTYMT